MSKNMDKFEKEVRDLKHCYRSIEAPPYLSSRIRARIQHEQATKHFWRPALAAIAFFVTIFGLLPFIANRESVSTVEPILPSMTSLSRLTANYPTSISPSLSHLRSVSMPPMPARPSWQPANGPQSHYESDKYQKPEENHHEYV